MVRIRLNPVKGPHCLHLRRGLTDRGLFSWGEVLFTRARRLCPGISLTEIASALQHDSVLGTVTSIPRKGSAHVWESPYFAKRTLLSPGIRPLFPRIRLLSPRIRTLFSQIRPLFLRIRPLFHRVRPLFHRIRPLSGGIRGLFHRIKPLSNWIAVYTGKTKNHYANAQKGSINIPPYSHCSGSAMRVHSRTPGIL
jgi:hypothetical protein